MLALGCCHWLTPAAASVQAHMPAQQLRIRSEFITAGNSSTGFLVCNCFQAQFTALVPTVKVQNGL